MDIDALNAKRWILLPGTLCTAEVFDDFLDLVGVEKDQRYPVTLKHAHVDDYLSVLNEFVRPGDVVCGFSLGAIVAAHLADRLEASVLFLFGLNPFADDPAKTPDRQSLADAVNAQGGRVALDSRLPPIHGPSPENARELILSMADNTSGFIGEQTTLALSRPGAMAELTAASCPIRLLTGTKDTSAPFELAQSVAEVAVDGRALAIEGLGHYALLEDPKLCYMALKEQGDHLI